MKALFLITLQCSASVIITVYIDESVTLAKLCCRCTDKIDTSPCGISHQIYTIHNSFFHLADMITEIFNTIIVLYSHLTIFTLHQLVHSTKTIFHDEKRLLITIPQSVQYIAQSLRVDLPYPLLYFHLKLHP